MKSELSKSPKGQTGKGADREGEGRGREGQTVKVHPMKEGALNSDSTYTNSGHVPSFIALYIFQNNYYSHRKTKK